MQGAGPVRRRGASCRCRCRRTGRRPRRGPRGDSHFSQRLLRRERVCLNNRSGPARAVKNIFIAKATVPHESAVSDVFKFITAKKANYPITWLCPRLQVSRASFYRWAADAGPSPAGPPPCRAVATRAAGVRRGRGQGRQGQAVEDPGRQGRARGCLNRRGDHARAGLEGGPGAGAEEDHCARRRRPHLAHPQPHARPRQRRCFASGAVFHFDYAEVLVMPGNGLIPVRGTEPGRKCGGEVIGCDIVFEGVVGAVRLEQCDAVGVAAGELA